MRPIITISALKYPNIIHYEWQGELLKITSEYVLVLCKAGRTLTHHTKGTTFTLPNDSLEFFSLKKGFTVAMEMENREIVSYYCNIAMPSVFENNHLSFIDLDLDLVKRLNNEWEVLDEDEFEINSYTYNYPPEFKDYVIQSLEELKGKIKREEFPFDGALLEE
ncbi:DUF402 domain-containing protein [Metabacillus indicus]|uniref:DUF402 domain-containing protein n=1 Tax=Metabacillus indicus TaxID=246786 RepID=UPI00049337A6|nr:DUF402 domain-containing protein [Metabacillus indicus]KEZ50853.1 hypothetical protein AZ46_0209455 [Metabacillus indicus LMG 22858]